MEFDTRSVTGRNLRTILLETLVLDVRSLKPADVTTRYRDMPMNEQYRVDFIKEMVNVKNNQLEVPGFTDDDILASMCLLMLVRRHSSLIFPDSFPGGLLFCLISKVELSNTLL